MRKLPTLFVLLFIIMTGQAQKKDLFDGGMMLHMGQMHSDISQLDYHSKGLTTGIGGALRFHIGNYLRLGGEGYVSTFKQMNNNGSYMRVSWGGVLADLRKPMGRWTPYVGFTIGGGSTSTLLLFSGDDSDWEAEDNAVLHNGKFMMIDPFVGVEYALTEAVHLTLKADRMVPLNNAAVASGIRVYLGFIFCH